MKFSTSKGSEVQRFRGAEGFQLGGHTAGTGLGLSVFRFWWYDLNNFHQHAVHEVILFERF